MNKSIKRILLSLLAVAVALAVGLDIVSDKKKTYQESKLLMGSIVTLSIDGETDGQAKKTSQILFDQVEMLENCISKNKDGTKVFAVNNGQEVADNELARYIKECDEISKLSKGAFDITVGALSSLWDFDDEKGIVPENDLISQSLQTIGYDKIKVDQDIVSVPSGTILDFGAAGKGMACDVALNSLSSLNTDSAVVSVGGSVGVHGKPATIGIRDPFGTSTESFATVKFKDAVASTSGVYEKHFEKDGINYHHILDPQTGYPVVSDIVSVTVIAKSGLASDSLATACFKLGFDESQEILDKYDAMAVFVYKDKKVKTVNEKYEFKIVDEAYEK